MTELSRYEAFEQWAEDYALDHEPLTITDRRMDCWAAYQAGAESERAVSDRLLAELRRVTDWIEELPVPTPNATAELHRIDLAIAEVEAMRKGQE